MLRHHPPSSFLCAPGQSSPATTPFRSYAMTAHIQPIFFNHFRTLAPCQRIIRPLFSYSCALFCTFLHFLAPTKIATSLFSCVCALFAKKQGVPYTPISSPSVPFWNATSTSTSPTGSSALFVAQPFLAVLLRPGTDSGEPAMMDWPGTNPLPCLIPALRPAHPLLQPPSIPASPHPPKTPPAAGSRT